MSTNFSTWILRERESRGWSLREIARRGGISAPSIIRTANDEQPPTLDVCVACAKAFGYPASTVLVLAGLIEGDADLLPEIVNWNKRVQALSPASRSSFLRAGEMMLEGMEAAERAGASR